MHGRNDTSESVSPTSTSDDTQSSSISRRSLEPWFARYGVTASPTAKDLYDLQVDIDHECLRHARDNGPDLSATRYSDVDSLAQLAIRLSGPISQLGHAGTEILYNAQLRALVSVLALLHYKGVRNLSTALWDELRSTNILDRFRSIAFRRSSLSRTMLDERISHAPNAYLIQLAAHYISFWRRGDSVWSSIVTPASNILFGVLSVAGGQYGSAQQILQGLNQIVNIWHRRQKKFISLCILQENTRQATSAFRQSTGIGNSANTNHGVTQFVLTLLGKVDELFADTFGEPPATLGNYWHRYLAAIHRGPPGLDRGFYFYGLLDCTAQLAAFVQPNMVPARLRLRLAQLVKHHRVPEFRWKASEILLSCSATREDSFGSLVDEIGDLSEDDLNLRLAEIEHIRGQLNDDDSNKVRLVASQPLEGHELDIEKLEIPPNPSPIYDINTSWQECSLPRSRLKEHPQAFSWSKDLRKPWNSSYDTAGLSRNCTQLYCQNVQKLCVIHIGIGEVVESRLKSPNFRPILGYELVNKPESESARNGRVAIVRQDSYEYICKAALSDNFLVIVSSKRMLIFETISGHRFVARAHDGWEPSALAIYEKEIYLVVALGQRTRHQGKTKGQILFHTYIIGQGFEKALNVEDLFHLTCQSLESDFPDHLTISEDGSILCCHTHKQNKIIVWEVGEQFALPTELVTFRKNGYASESYYAGITSISTYTSPSDRLYLFCTTSPSSERWKHDDEWSFAYPLPINPSPEEEPPITAVHNFVQLSKNHAYISGSVSDVHHVFAILEETGKIYVFSLVAHENGGIYSPEPKAMKLPVALPKQKQEQWSPSCFRFDPSGNFLFAVDPKGTIVKLEFERCSDPSRLSSPSNTF